MKDVLDLESLTKLPRPFAATLSAIHDRYESLPPEHLEKVAHKYGARYVLTAHRIDSWESRRADLRGNESWLLYDLSR
jgi:hypothetical protein